MIGEQIRDVHCSIQCYVFIQRTESLQHVDIISDTFRSPISSYPVFKGAKTKSFQFSTNSNLKLYIA